LTLDTISLANFLQFTTSTFCFYSFACVNKRMMTHTFFMTWIWRSKGKLMREKMITIITNNNLWSYIFANWIISMLWFLSTNITYTSSNLNITIVNNIICINRRLGLRTYYWSTWNAIMLFTYWTVESTTRFFLT
jgi:hypothetical protein